MNLADAAAEILLGKDEVLKNTGAWSSVFDDVQEKDQVLLTIAGVMVEACRNGLQGDELNSMLVTDHLLDSKSAKAIAGVIEKSSPQITSGLSELSLSSPFPSLHSVNWRFDLNIGQNDSARSTREPVFHVCLNSVQKTEKDKPIQAFDKVLTYTIHSTLNSC